MPRQPRLPAEEFQPTQAEIDIGEAAEKYMAARDIRMEHTKEEVNRRDYLLSLMHDHNLRTFSVDGISVEIILGDEKIKVKRNNLDEITEEE